MQARTAAVPALACVVQQRARTHARTHAHARTHSQTYRHRHTETDTDTDTHLGKVGAEGLVGRQHDAVQKVLLFREVPEERDTARRCKGGRVRGKGRKKGRVRGREVAREGGRVEDPR